MHYTVVHALFEVNLRVIRPHRVKAERDVPRRNVRPEVMRPAMMVIVAMAGRVRCGIDPLSFRILRRSTPPGPIGDTA
jgi:hypothetical protein